MTHKNTLSFLYVLDFVIYKGTKIINTDSYKYRTTINSFHDRHIVKLLNLFCGHCMIKYGKIIYSTFE